MTCPMTLFTVGTMVAAGIIPSPQPFGPLPTERPLRRQALAFYGFLHFTVNTSPTAANSVNRKP